MKQVIGGGGHRGDLCGECENINYIAKFATIFIEGKKVKVQICRYCEVEMK